MYYGTPVVEVLNSIVREHDMSVVGDCDDFGSCCGYPFDKTERCTIESMYAGMPHSNEQNATNQLDSSI